MSNKKDKDLLGKPVGYIVALIELTQNGHLRPAGI
jgi:hypothetical protein